MSTSLPIPTGAPAPADKPSLLARFASWALRTMATKRGYALVYGMAFAAVAFMMAASCLMWGKSMLNLVDAMWQQYPWFVYGGRWIRDLVSNLLAGNGLEPIMWEMASGYGVDVIQSIAGIFLNPMFLVSAFVPERFAEFALEGMTFLTLYAGGLAFSFWCLRRGEMERPHVMLGALTYSFAGNILLLFSSPSFMIMLLAFPLMLWAADLVFERRSPLPFILIMTWSFACSYYDSYMACILLVLYCTYAFVTRVNVGQPRQGAVKRFLGWAGVFVGYVAIALLMSCVAMLPQVMALVGMDRLDIERTVPLTYTLPWYLRYLAGYLTHTFFGNDAYMGFNALVPVVLVVLVLRRKKHKGLLVAFLVLTAMMMIPWAGSLMNGLQYPANRWVYGYDLLVSLIVAKLIPDLLSLERRERLWLVIALMAYGAPFIFLPIPGAGSLFAAQFVIMMVIVVILFAYAAGDGPRTFVGVTACLVVSLVVNLAAFVSPYAECIAPTLVGFGKVDDFHTSLNPTELIEQADAQGLYDPTYRYDQSIEDGFYVYNSNLVTGHMGSSFYNSIYSDEVDDFHMGLGLITTAGINFRYASLDYRAALETVLAMRYLGLTEAESSMMLPYSYKGATALVSAHLRSNRLVTLYDSPEVLPLAFGYTSWVPRSYYDACDPIERQELLMQAVTLPDEAAGTLAVPDASDAAILEVTEQPVKVKANWGCEFLEDGSLLVRKEGASLRLSFDAAADAENYLVIEGLSYQDIPVREYFTDEEWNVQLSFIDRIKRTIEGLFTEDRAEASLSVKSNWITSVVNVLSPIHHLYGGKDDDESALAVNLGYFAEGDVVVTGDRGPKRPGHDGEGACSIEVIFNAPGIYDWSYLGVQAQPMAGFDADFDRLNANAAQDIVIGRNQVSCTTSSDVTTELFFSIAYGEGWSATIDGQEAPILNANVAFMAVEVPAGEHEVVLRYRTPYLTEGAYLSLAGVAACAVTCGALRRSRRIRAAAAERAAA